MNQIEQKFVVIRFTASEVFLDARKCVINATEIANVIEDGDVNNYTMGYSLGVNRSLKECNKA